ncbi:MAG: SDR family NAD(P)-dependent oxidoreductase [Myxococcota bacterium]
MVRRSSVLTIESDPVAEVLATMGLRSDAFAGKVALVTGGARGIGEQTARGLAALGATVVIADIREAQGEQVAASIGEAGGRARFEPVDIAYERNVEQLAARIERLEGPVDVLLNNAVQIDVQSILETSTEHWDYALDTNVRAPFLLIRRLLPSMLERKTGIIANMVALEGMAYSAAMSASKVALRSLIFSLCDELPPQSGVSVFGFSPGLVATDMVFDVVPQYTERIGVPFEEFVLGQPLNPGYEGMMPAEHCAAALIHTLRHAPTHHGLLTDPYGPLADAGIIERPVEDARPRLADNASRLRDHITDIRTLRTTIDDKVRERTEALEAQSTQAQSLASVGMLAAGVAHEINNPLTYVMANLEEAIERLAEAGHSDPELAEILDESLTGVQQIRAIVADMKLLSRMKQEDEAEQLDLHAVLDRTLRVVSGELRHRARVIKDYGNPCPVTAGEARLSQVFINLLVNAGHAIEPGHALDNEIRISTATDKLGHATVTIHDTGKGMPPEVQERIFNPFFTTKAKGKGTGLGLSICQGIIEKLGGSIYVASEEGLGTSIRVTLPPAEGYTRRAPAPARTIDPRLDRARILLADDDEGVCRAVGRMIAEHDVLVVHSGREALHKLQGTPGLDAFDLVLTDLMMADVTGVEVYERVLAAHPDAASRFVFLTGGALTAEAHRLLERPGVRVLTKPFRRHELQEVVVEALRWRNRQRDPAPLRLLDNR